MENPPQEISKVLDLVDSVYSPELQQAAIEKYFLPDAGFRYPIYEIAPGPASRDKIAGVYQWLHIISPRTKGVIHHISYDKARNILLLDVTQHLHMLYLPFMASKSRMLTRLTLKKQGGLHYISLQEDFMHTDGIVSLLFPPLKRVAHTILIMSGFVLCFLARVAQMLGIYAVDPAVEEEIKLKRKDRKRRKIAIAQNESAPLPDNSAGTHSEGHSKN